MKLLLSLALLVFTTAHAAPVKLFDGKTLNGWDGNTEVWRVQDGAITGGSLNGNPHNEFISTKKSYKNFTLQLEYKLTGTEGFINGGVQFRSIRLTKPDYEMSGYQADIGMTYSGSLYDESRRRKMLLVANKDLITRLEKPGEWNTYKIIAEGSRIRLFLNGKMTADYTERETGIAEDGLIALQIHGNAKSEIAYRNITIEEMTKDLVPEKAVILNRFGNGPNLAVKLEPWKDGKFVLEENEVFVFAGQTNLVRDQKNGALESLLATGFAKQKPSFRSMAWEADTVYDQWRDLNFGSWTNQLEAAGATIVVAQFGQMEAFDGPDRLPEFSSAYHRLLDQFVARTPRLVLISPMPFEKPTAPDAPDLTERNDDAAAYTKAVADVAKHRNAVFIDLFTPLSQRDAKAPRLTRDGIHLTDEGLQVVAEIIAKQLGAQATTADLAAIREAIVEKNRLWFDCWRPANWSFVYGDRVSQLFGKPAGDAPSLRESFENRKPLVEAMDGRIQAMALGEKPAPMPPQPSAPKTEDVMTPDEEKATFTLAEGYEINLFASEVEGVAKPTQITWDEYGRLYVACSPTYPQTVPGVKPSDFILVLEDTKGTGHADKYHHYADGLTMIEGLEPGNGGMYVCDFDQLLHLRDADADGRADETKVIFSGFGIGDTHQLINSITHGPDGSLWFTQGLHAFSRVETPWGIAKLEKSGVWRMHPRRLQLDAFFNGGKAGHNCWGVAFDDYGQVFHKSGDRPDGYYTVPGMVNLKDPDEYHPIGSLFATTPKTTSLDIIGTRAMPDNVQGCAIIGGYFGNVLEFHRFIDDGSGFKTEQLPKLLRSSSTAFRPVDVSVGPDGAIYVADWFNPIIGHYQASYADPRRDRTHGRIWRITAKGHPRVKQPDLASMAPKKLMDQLRSPERWTRYQAKRVLFDAPQAEVLEAADAWVAKRDPSAPDYEHSLLEAIGVFQAHESPRPELLEKLLDAKDFRVRAYGTRVIGDWASKLSDPLAMLQERIHDENPRVRLEAIVACSYVPKPETVEVLVQALDSPRDKFIDYAMAQSIRALQPLWKPALAAGKLTFGGNAAHAEYLKKIASTAPVAEHPGKIVYDALCLNCHQPGGNGLPGVYPALAGSDWIAGDAATLAKIVIHGLSGPIKVKGKDFKQVAPVPMPPMGLNDQQIADVLTYIRNNFGNHAPAVKPDEVKAVRDATSSRSVFWTEEELKK